MAVEILDGAVGTELIARGLPVDEARWTARAALDAPALLGAVHADYARAGATLHTANTFRTQPGVFGEGWREALAAAVRVARASVPGGHRVAGSIAPLADCYRPDLSPGEGARESHRRVAHALCEEGCDVLLCETFANELEALAAAEEAVRTGLPVWLSLTPGPFGDLLTPEELRGVGERAASTGIERLLVNCVAASRAQPYVEALAAVPLPFGVYANAGARAEGLGWEATGAEAVDAYAAHAQGWVDAGAGAVGGCCGTRPLHVEALAARFG